MSFFGSIGHFFESLFGKNSNVAQTVLHDVSSFVTLAEPIVEDVNTIIKAAPQSGTALAIEKFLSKYEADASKVASLAQNLAALPTADMWRNAALVALQFVAPSGTATSLLNLAIELAYQIIQKKKQPSTTTPAAPQPVPVNA
jgi:hypothetical protein